MLAEREAGLFCEAGGFYIDPWGPVDRALITHAHGDHARQGSRAYLCADPAVLSSTAASVTTSSSNRCPTAQR